MYSAKSHLNPLSLSSINMYILLLVEGGITSLQGYQVLRNCGTELLYEKPEERVELAHYFWDQLMEKGECCILL